MINPWDFIFTSLLGRGNDTFSPGETSGKGSILNFPQGFQYVHILWELLCSCQLSEGLVGSASVYITRGEAIGPCP